jgi:hypothetical protein
VDCRSEKRECLDVGSEPGRPNRPGESQTGSRSRRQRDFSANEIRAEARARRRAIKGSPMKLLTATLLAFVFFLLTTNRLPAPIQELQESPTPTATSAQHRPPTSNPPAQPRKSPSKPKSKPSGAARLAGTWIGRITADKMGGVDVRLVISSDGTSVAQNSKAGVWTRPLTYDGRLLSWQTGPTNAVAWTLTLNPDEQSALVRRTWSRYRSSANFKRVQSY